MLTSTSQTANDLDCAPVSDLCSFPILCLYSASFLRVPRSRPGYATRGVLDILKYAVDLSLVDTSIVTALESSALTKIWIVASIANLSTSSFFPPSLSFSLPSLSHLSCLPFSSFLFTSFSISFFSSSRPSLFPSPTFLTFSLGLSAAVGFCAAAAPAVLLWTCLP